MSTNPFDARRFLKLLALAVACFATAWIVQLIVMPVWPPAGVSLVAMLVLGWRISPRTSLRRTPPLISVLCNLGRALLSACVNVGRAIRMGALFLATARRALATVFLLLMAGMTLAQQDAGRPLVVGSEEDYPPFAIGKTDEAAGGFTVELWKAVAAEHALKYTIRVRPFRQILEEFKAGKIDVMINLAQSDERRAFADFSVPHVIVHGAIFVRKGESRIRSEADFGGKSIIVLDGDLAHDYAISKGWEKQLVLVDTAAEGLTLLGTGQHDAMLLSKLAGMQTLLALKIRNVTALNAKAGFSQKFSFAVQKGNAELLAKVNEGLAVAKSTGTYDALYEKWFGVFEAQGVTFRQLLKYLGPVVIAFLIFTGIFLAKQRDRKKAEKALREREEQLRFFVEDSPAAIAMLDREMRYIVASRRWLSDYHLGNRPIIGRSHYEVFPDLPERWKEIHRRCLGGAIEKCEEDMFSRADGTVEWIRWEVRPWHDARGGIRGIILFSEVITERKRAEERLAEREAHLRAIVDSEPQCVKLLAADGSVLEMNPAGLAMLEADSFEQVRGMKMVGLILPEYRAAFEELIRRVFAGEPGELEFAITTLKGTQRWLETHAVPLRHKEGEVHAMLGITLDITARKQAEAALREREAGLASFKRTLDQTHDCVFMFDPDSLRFIYCNLGAVKQVGYTEAELFTMTPVDLKPEFTEQSFREMLQPLKDGRKTSQVFETVHRRKEGHEMNVEVSLQLAREEGRQGLFVAVVRDITERMEAEAALRESEDRFRKVFEEGPVGIAMTSLPEGKFVCANRAFCEMLGYTEEELKRLTFPEVTHPDHRAVDDEAIAQLREGKIQSHHTEKRYVKKNGEEVWGARALTGIRGADGKTFYALAVVQNITERTQTEAALRQSEAEFRAMTEASPLGIFVTDCNGLTTYTNATFRRMLDIGFQKVSREGWAEAIHPQDREASLEKWHQAIASEQSFESSIRFIRPDGKTIQTSIKTAVMREHGRVLGYVAVVEDITEKKALEERLLRTQRMESIGTLASGLAHDLNNILAPIMMSVPILRMEITPEQRERSIATIEMSAERGSQIIRQVLTFGRGLEGEKHPLQFGALINEMVKIAHGTFPKDIAIESTVKPGLWPVLGDATQMHQILLNLCINARDAMPEGGNLRLSARNLPLDASYASMVPGTAPGPHVLLEVSDDGSGIPPEIIERIFDPFFTTKGIGQGTGLGLSTVLGIVKSHSGHITVKSTPGEGTTFQIYLPAAADACDAPTASGPAAPPPRGRGEVVLLVDDEEPVRSAAGTVLEAYGYRVLQAADGIEALAVFAKNSAAVAAVITDLMMPIMDGVALIHALRKMQPGLPIVASTALNEKTRMAELKALNVESVLNKPYTANVLLHALHEALHPAANTTMGAL